MIELVDVDMTLSESDVTEQKVDEWQLQLAPTKSFELTGDPSELILKSPVALDYNIGPSGTYVSVDFWITLSCPYNIWRWNPDPNTKWDKEWRFDFNLADTLKLVYQSEPRPLTDFSSAAVVLFRKLVIKTLEDYIPEYQLTVTLKAHCGAGNAFIGVALGYNQVAISPQEAIGIARGDSTRLPFAERSMIASTSSTDLSSEPEDLSTLDLH